MGEEKNYPGRYRGTPAKGSDVLQDSFGFSGSRVELRKFVAPEFVSGQGARRLAARYAMNFGASKALIVTAPASSRRAGPRRR